MGKSLIILGADFSVNGMKGDTDVTPSDYWVRGYNCASKAISTSGASTYAIFKVPVQVGKIYRIYVNGGHYQNIWGITAEKAEAEFTAELTPDISYGTFPDPAVSGGVTYKDVTIDTYPYMIFSARVTSQGSETEDLKADVKVIELVE